MQEVSRIYISRFTEKRTEEWDNYVSNSRDATFFHLSGWQYVLEKTFGYKTYYLFAENEGEICGILPLFLIKNLLSGKALVSLPFGVYGGVCADDDYISKLLIEEAKAITREENAGYLELRNRVIFKSDMPAKNLYATFIKELPQKKEECLKQLPRKARAAARKGINSGLQAETGIDLLKEFYNVYAVSVRNLGSPVFPFSFLTNLVEKFRENTTVLFVKYKNRPVAGVFTFLFKDTVIPYYGGSLPQYFKYQPNNFMYLKLMEYGTEKGYRFFDFGRSKEGTGSYNFKVFQGFEPQRLHYQYYLNTLDAIPDASSLNPKLSLVIKMWKRLPVCLTKIIGAKIIGCTPP